MKVKICILLCVILFCYFDLTARPLSIAGKAKIKASSELNPQVAAENINDGIMAVENKGCWMAKGKNGWVQLTWSKFQRIDKVVIYNFPFKKGRVTKGQLLFSDGSKVEVNLPEDGTVKAIEFPEKTIKSVRFLTIDGVGDNLGLSEIEVFPSPNQYNDPVSWVDPYIETNRGRFFYFITGSRPFGVVSAAPMTINGNNGGGGYAHKSTEILGFPQIHSWTISGINLMPTLADIDPTMGEQSWKSTFKHDDEIVQPGYHRVYMPKYSTWVEQSSTDRVSFYRFTWTKDTLAQILVSLGGKLGNSRMANAEVKKISDTEFEGSVSSVDRAYDVGPVDVKIFFVVQLDKACQSFDGWEGEKRFKNRSSLKGDSSGVALIYHVKSGDQLNMKIAVSYTNIERIHLDLEW